jgi:hypothetical protein
MTAPHSARLQSPSNWANFLVNRLMYTLLVRLFFDIDMRDALLHTQHICNVAIVIPNATGPLHILHIRTTKATISM